MCRVPTLSKIKPRMVYAGSKEDFKKSLAGISTEIQGTDASEVDYNSTLFVMLFLASSVLTLVVRFTLAVVEKLKRSSS